MATKRPSVQKREREYKRRERKLEKAARAAEKRAVKPITEVQSPPAEITPQKEAQR